MTSSHAHRPRSSIRHASTAIAAAFVLLIGCGDDNEPGELVGSGPFPVAELDIVYDHPDERLRYVVGCQGDTTSTAGDADLADVTGPSACRALADPELRSRLIDGPPEGRVCTDVFGGPAVATVIGTLDGFAVDARFDRTDGCAIDDWDRLAGQLLPAASGLGRG